MNIFRLSWLRIVSVACIFISVNVAAQEDSTSFFSCSQIKEDIEQFNSLEKSNKTWAERILKLHSLVGNNIRYTYIIEAKDTFNIEAMMNNTRAWLGETTSSEIMAVNVFDKENHVIEAPIAYDRIGEASGYGSISIVSAIMNIQIAFKENKIKFDAWVSHFYISSASNFSKNKAGAVPVSESYPVKEKGKHKSSLAMAFININSGCINRALSYLNYMEKHHKENIKRYDPNW